MYTISPQSKKITFGNNKFGRVPYIGTKNIVITSCCTTLAKNGNLRKGILNSFAKEGEFEGMTEVLSAILGAVVTYWFGIRQERKKEKKEESHATSILYYDLKSIYDVKMSEDENELKVSLQYVFVCDIPYPCLHTFLLPLLP